MMVLATSPVNSIERRDKLGTGGFIKAIEFFFLFGKSPRNELIKTGDNCSLQVPQKSIERRDKLITRGFTK